MAVRRRKIKRFVIDVNTFITIFINRETEWLLQYVIPIVAAEFHVNSPDKEDNYLYNIALTAHAKLLVTGEKALLSWAQSPVETINLTSFKQLF